MLRNQEERKFARDFTKIDTWEEFLKRWEAIDTEQEAVGLLYAGVSVGGMNKDKAEFYIKWSSHDNPKVSTAAQQIIVKHLLGNTVSFSDLNPLFLRFLQERKRALIKPPYPRFIAHYLVNTHPKDRSEKELWFRACLTWGLGYKLEDYMEAVPFIEEFLKNEGVKKSVLGVEYDIKRILSEVLINTEPIAEFSNDYYLSQKILQRAAFALLKIRNRQGLIKM